MNVFIGPLVAHAAEELDTSRNSRSAVSQSSTSWPCSRPRSQYSSNARRAMSFSVTPDPIAAAFGDSTHGIVSPWSVFRLADFGILHLRQVLDNHSRRCGTPTPVRTGCDHRSQTPTAAALGRPPVRVSGC